MMFRIIILISFFMVVAANAELAISTKDSSCSSRRDSNADVVKLAHVIGSDSRTSDFSYGASSGYYNSSLQSDMAENNLSHIQCKQGDKWNRNTTSGFFVDVEDYARQNNIIGNFSSCRNKVLVTVAHYINDKGGKYNAKCKVRKSFKTSLGKNEFGLVENIHTGDNYSSEHNNDFAFLKIDGLRFSEDENFKTLKICNDYRAMNSVSGQSCNGDFKNDIILPHLALTENDQNAVSKGMNYKAKLSSGKCCISGNISELSLLGHTCDMDERSSGAPLLNISGIGEPCVVGIQKGHSGVGIKENYAVSVTGQAFRSQFKRYIESNCSGSSSVSSIN